MPCTEKLNGSFFLAICYFQNSSENVLFLASQIGFVSKLINTILFTLLYITEILLTLAFNTDKSINQIGFWKSANSIEHCFHENLAWNRRIFRFLTRQCSSVLHISCINNVSLTSSMLVAIQTQTNYCVWAVKVIRCIW